MAKKEKALDAPEELDAKAQAGAQAKATAKAQADADAEVRRLEDENFNSRFSLAGIPGAKGLKYLEAEFCDSDGQKYRAFVQPLPTNKGSLLKVAGIRDPQGEINRIAHLPFEQQADAIAEYQRAVLNPRQALAIGGAARFLMEYQGHLMYCEEKQTETGQKVEYPTANLIVNLSRKAGQPRWQLYHSVRPAEYVPTPGKGEKPCAHFRLV